MKRSHKKVIDALNAGQRLDRSSCAWHLVGTRATGKLMPPTVPVQNRVIDEMVALGLLSVQAVGSTGEYRPTPKANGDKSCKST